jgi:hypothetical protein
VLARLPGSIRVLKSAEELVPGDQAGSSPREVMRLVTWLMDHAGADVRVPFFRSWEPHLILSHGRTDSSSSKGTWPSKGPSARSVPPLSSSPRLIIFFSVSRHRRRLPDPTAYRATRPGARDGLDPPRPPLRATDPRRPGAVARAARRRRGQGRSVRHARRVPGCVGERESFLLLAAVRVKAPRADGSGYA